MPQQSGLLLTVSRSLHGSSFRITVPLILLRHRKESERKDGRIASFDNITRKIFHQNSVRGLKGQSHQSLVAKTPTVEQVPVDTPGQHPLSSNIGEVGENKSING